MWSETLVRVEEIQGRGRGVVSSQPLRGGDIVVRDSPILLYSAFPLPLINTSLIYCDNCFRKLQSAVVSCPSCSHHKFCSQNCVSASSHSPWVCQAFTHLSLVLQHQPLERQIQARFLIAAYSLALTSPAKFQILLSLQGQGRGDDEDAQFLHSLISSLCPPTAAEGSPFSLELTSSLLAKDKLNAFGLMEPFNFNSNDNHNRSVRGYGIYPKASLFNHDCLPNACRFDYLDDDTSPAGCNTDLIIRMIHDVPRDREICLSYFPVNHKYSTRQGILLDDYGFICDCDRCKVEANWSDHEDEDEDEDDENDAMEEDPDESMVDEEDAASDDGADFPHAYFFLRYMCNRTNCWGTLAPLPPSTPTFSTHLLECNVCGNIKKTDEVGADADDGEQGY